MTTPEGRPIDDDRPTPESMLARIGDRPSGGRGRLRVYLGMAPGVGKTYKMLEEAHRRLDRGTDLVVGFVETHGRQRTADLLTGLEVVPRRRIEYRGVVIDEMDTDAVIARGPAVAIVDELAHTNVPGSPREKRWQDVELIRDAGIDVISTCNVQHLESVADAVATITGAPVNERLPDAELGEADEIELVDMSPHALRQRMRHGNVYPPERTQVALERFFTEANLTALRELALRFVSGQVDAELEDLQGEPGEVAPRQVAERVGVLISGDHSGRRAIRRAAALANMLRAPLVGIAVRTPRAGRLPFDRARDLRENLDYAADLGAVVVQPDAATVLDGLVEAATARRLTRLVLPHVSSGRWERLARQPLAGQVLARLPDVEILLVGPGEDAHDPFRVGS
jgi:two-component system, OmpR family, sensor histidine kinase KdpD